VQNRRRIEEEMRSSNQLDCTLDGISGTALWCCLLLLQQLLLERSSTAASVHATRAPLPALISCLACMSDENQLKVLRHPLCLSEPAPTC
jgi:hypothetical protein